MRGRRCLISHKRGMRSCDCQNIGIIEPVAHQPE
jgi:hypothetical protein